MGHCSLPETGVPDPVLAGALRVSEALEGGATTLVGVWQRAPLQAIARLHALAAADLTDDDRLGRPRGDADVGSRLELLVDLVTGELGVPAAVLAAVAHGELLTLAPFGIADGLGGACGVAAGHDLQRPGPARPRRAGGVLDEPVGRLPCRSARICFRHTRRPCGMVDAELPRAARRCEGGAVDRGGRRRSSGPSKVKAGGAPKLVRLAAR